MVLAALALKLIDADPPGHSGRIIIASGREPETGEWQATIILRGVGTLFGDQPTHSSGCCSAWIWLIQVPVQVLQMSVQTQDSAHWEVTFTVFPQAEVGRGTRFLQ